MTYTTFDVEDCPVCGGMGLVPQPNDDGDDPEMECDCCAGVGQVPIGYARAYERLQQRIRELETELAWAQRHNAAPNDSPRRQRVAGF